jgi:hypothetical protein
VLCWHQSEDPVKSHRRLGCDHVYMLTCDRTAKARDCIVLCSCASNACRSVGWPLVWKRWRGFVSETADTRVCINIQELWFFGCRMHMPAGVLL